jgi:hypothetical protein
VDDDITELPSYSVNGGGGDNLKAATSYREIFENALPNYLFMGMTPEQFWNEDSTLVVAYRKAFEMKQEADNTRMWLQGAYIYDAISRLIPIMQPFAKKGTKAVPYLEKPYPLKEDSDNEDKPKDKNIEQGKVKALEWMQEKMAAINGRFNEV